MSDVALGWVLDLATRVGAADARMADVAAWVGAFEDPTGFGEQLSADPPALAGAVQASVLGRPPAGAPEVVIVQLTEGERPTIEELEAELGPGQDGGPFPAGDRLLVFPQPGLGATVVARIEDDEATELSVRRDRLPGS